MREYATCVRCEEPILRFPGGMWEHAIDASADWDHAPEPEDESEHNSDGHLVRGGPDVREMARFEPEWRLRPSGLLFGAKTVKPRDDLL